MHEQITNHIIKQNEELKKSTNKHRSLAAFKEGEQVWIHLGKEWFPRDKHGKLKLKAYDPFRILQRIDDNALKLELPSNYGVLITFNMVDLSLYHDEDNSLNQKKSLINLGDISFWVLISKIKVKSWDF